MAQIDDNLLQETRSEKVQARATPQGSQDMVLSNRSFPRELSHRGEQKRSVPQTDDFWPDQHEALIDLKRLAFASLNPPFPLLSAWKQEFKDN